MIDLRFDELCLHDQLFVIFPLEFVEQFVKNCQRVLVFLLFEIEFGQLVLNLHSQKRSAFLGAPLDDVFGQVDEWIISMSSWELEAHIKHRTNDLSSLTFWQIDVHGEHHLSQIDELVKETLLTENSRQSVGGLLLGLNGVIVDLVLIFEFVGDDALVDRDGVTLVVFILEDLALFKFFG